MADWLYGQEIWNGLMLFIGNEMGVAGLMGNLVAESGLIPYRVQGDFSEGYTVSINYTNDVNNGIISEYDFVNNGPDGGGYGLAQWTYYTRKQKMYDMKQSLGVSIGSVELAVALLQYELRNNYTNVFNTLKSCTDIRTASDIVLHDFESPADQSEVVEIVRYNNSVEVYNTYSGSPIPTGKSKFKFIYYMKRRFF